MIQTILSWLLAIFFLAIIPSADAQQLGKIPRIGFLSGSGDRNTPGLQLEAFRRGLQELGYIEGKNILVEYRYVEGRVDRIPSLVAELMQLNVDVFISGNLVAIRAAKQATHTIPIVMVTTADPVTAGLIDSLARPGRNITGLSRINRDLKGKRLELLKEVIPRISRVGILWDTSSAPELATAFKDYETAAHALKIPDSILKGAKFEPRFGGSISKCGQGACERARYD